jgi:hypothetical protein
MTEKDITSKPVLPLYLRSYISNDLSLHFLAFAFIAITFWSKECVITGIKGLISSGYVTVTLFRMRSAFRWKDHWTTCQPF